MLKGRVKMRPKVSVILTTYNARERLRFALTSYRYQTYPLDRFEVIIVDDGSTDGSKEWFESQNWNYAVRYIYNSTNKGRAGARNVGIHAATGEIIIFSDCDMIAQPDFIERHVGYHITSDNLVVCGSFWNPIYSHIYQEEDKYIIRKVKELVRDRPELQKRFSVAYKKLRDRPFAKLLSASAIPKISESELISPTLPIANYFTPYINERGGIIDRFYFPWIFFVVMNVSVRKKHLERIGDFDEDFVGYGGEDTDIGYRLWQAGLQYIADANLKNYHQEHPRNRTKQEGERSRNRYYLAKKHPTIEMIMHLYVPFGNDKTKSDFLYDRDRLLHEGKISYQFFRQLEWLVWKSAHTSYPHFQEELEKQLPIDAHQFWQELNYVRSLSDVESFVVYIDQLIHYVYQ